jgi:hypothetical protein
MYEQGWCAAHLQTIREMIVFWQIQVVKTVAILNGDTNPSAAELNQVVSKTSDMTCIPNEVNLPQMARVLVKWLRDHPERLHEPISILSMDAFHGAFPCVASTPKAGPAPAKPQLTRPTMADNRPDFPHPLGQLHGKRIPDC